MDGCVCVCVCVNVSLQMCSSLFNLYVIFNNLTKHRPFKDLNAADSKHSPLFWVRKLPQKGLLPWRAKPYFTIHFHSVWLHTIDFGWRSKSLQQAAHSFAISHYYTNIYIIHIYWSSLTLTFDGHIKIINLCGSPNFFFFRLNSVFYLFTLLLVKKMPSFF